MEEDEKERMAENPSYLPSFSDQGGYSIGLKICPKNSPKGHLKLMPASRTILPASKIAWRINQKIAPSDSYAIESPPDDPGHELEARVALHHLQLRDHRRQKEGRARFSGLKRQNLAELLTIVDLVDWSNPKSWSSGKFWLSCHVTITQVWSFEPTIDWNWLLKTIESKNLVAIIIVSNSGKI